MQSLLFRWAACALIALSGVSSVLFAEETVGDRVKEAVDRAGEKMEGKTNERAYGRIHTMLTQATEAALSTKGFDNLVNCFNDADRDRIKPWFNDAKNKERVETLNGRIAQFNKEWKAKYNADFDIKDNNVVWGGGKFVDIALGEIGRDAQLAGHKIPAGDDQAFGGDKNLNKGRNVAYLRIAQSHNLPGLNLPLIHEMPDAWKIDVPNSIDGNKLCEYLLYRVTFLSEHKDHWPADVNEAYRMVGHHVLLATVGATDDKKSFTVEFGGNAAKADEMMDRSEDRGVDKKNNTED